MNDRVVGWAFIGCAVIVVVAQIARTSQGYSETLYEWPVVLFIAALFLLIGIANLGMETSRRLTAAVLAGCGLFYLGVGVAALVSPDAMTVTSSRLGPTTAGAARVAGVVLVVAGSALQVGAWRVGRRNTASRQGSER
ncbi:hypothetical protein [Ilumatobacter sp.]|uniref:hypothetical protein n=1 Tax=Ilumatobacter sp. TaxID=1967498 RepID=UPI003C3E968E